MASSGKTPNLQLNRWVGTDTPKMDDFNEDNSRIDAAVQGHKGDTAVHLSNADRARFNEPMLTGSYLGDGAQERTIHVGFAPRFGIVFCEDSFLCEYDPNYRVTGCGFGFLLPGGGSLGVYHEGNGFLVVNVDPPAATYSIAKMNKLGYTYRYVMWK